MKKSDEMKPYLGKPRTSRRRTAKTQIAASTHPLQRLRLPSSWRRGDVRKGASIPVILSILFVVSLIVAGLIFALGGSGGEELGAPVLVTAEKGLFEARVLDQGEIQSSDNYEFRCEVSSRFGETKVIWVIEEGKHVEAGDVLVELDRAKLDEALNEQQIAVNTGEKLVQQAQSALDAAVQAKEEYDLGTFVELERTIQNEIFLAEQELRQAEQYLQHSERLAAKSYVTDLQLESDRFAVEKAQNSLDLARQKLEILRNQTKKRMEIELSAQIDALTVDLENERDSLEIEKDLLEEINDQIEKCTIVVPEGVSGQVVYANKYNRRGSEWVLEEGAMVMERQVLIRLPNPSQMQVRATVNESQIASVAAGQPVSIRVDALNDAPPLTGEVVKVNQYAEPDGWGGGGIRKYAVFIQINDPPATIRPGMNASVNILVERQEDAVLIPIQCLYERRKEYFVLIKNGETFETREVEVGSTNSKSAWIVSGIDSGEEVVMAPRKHPELLELPEIPGVE